jgi:hypothetical protein
MYESILRKKFYPETMQKFLPVFGFFWGHNVVERVFAISHVKIFPIHRFFSMLLEHAIEDSKKSLGGIDESAIGIEYNSFSLDHGHTCL